MDRPKTYSIGEAAEAIGVTPSTLRSWERRYGLVTPTRSPGGHRRYSEADIDRLRVFAEIARRRRAGETVDLLAEIDTKA